MYLSGPSAVEQGRSVSSGRGLRCVFAAGSKGDRPQQPQKPKQRVKLPERGFFAEADTKGGLSVFLIQYAWIAMALMGQIVLSEV